MDVFLCWDENDYYGPDPMERLVFANLDDAKRSIEKHVRDHGDQPIGWTKASYGDRWELQKWVGDRSVWSLYFIDRDTVR